MTGAANANKSHLGRRTVDGIGRCERDDDGFGAIMAWWRAIASIDIGIASDGVMILALKSSIPGGVGGDTDDAGDVDVECDASGVGGKLGDDGDEERYMCSWCGAPGTDEAGSGGLGVGFGGEDVGPWPWTKDGTGTAAVLYGVVDGIGEGAGDGSE